MKGMGQFNPEFYQRYRPFYPASLFEDLNNKLVSRKFSPPFKVADIGCGTGHSSLSILRTQLPMHLIGIDPDEKMLHKACENKNQFALLPSQTLEFIQGRGEATGLVDHSIDSLLVGSAFHWMDPMEALDEFHRILAPRGLIRIFEYQFPKAIHLPELNEWIRRQFNLYWKAPGQIPRGSLREITQVFRTSSYFESLGEGRPPMKLYLECDELAGLIFSQSRVLHFESTLDEAEVISFREHVQENLKKLMNHSPAECDFKLSYFDFARTK